MNRIAQTALWGTLIFICSCTPITESTGKVLDNAGSVIRSGSENLWIAPEESAQKKKQEPKLPQSDEELRY